MEKVSVPTRCPCMKTPNEPESTASMVTGTGAGLSFLSSAAAVNIAHRQSAAKATICPITRILLLKVRLLTPAPDCMPPPPRLRPHLCRGFQCGQPLSYTTAAASRTVLEIAWGFAATDEPKLQPCISSAIPRPAHPEKPNAPSLFQANRYLRTARTLLHPMPRREMRILSLTAIRVTQPFRRFGIPLLRTLGKSVRWSFLLEVGYARPSIRMANPIGGSEPGRRKFFGRPGNPRERSSVARLPGFSQADPMGDANRVWFS